MELRKLDIPVPGPLGHLLHFSSEFGFLDYMDGGASLASSSGARGNVLEYPCLEESPFDNVSVAQLLQQFHFLAPPIQNSKRPSNST